MARWVCGGWAGEINKMGRRRGWVGAGLVVGQRVSLSWQLGWRWRKKRENEEATPSEFGEREGSGINEKEEKKKEKKIYIYITTSVNTQIYMYIYIHIYYIIFELQCTVKPNFLAVSDAITIRGLRAITSAWA